MAGFHTREAFGELYDAHDGQVYGYALRRAADTENARDVTSAVFHEPFRHIKDYRWRISPFLTGFIELPTAGSLTAKTRAGLRSPMPTIALSLKMVQTHTALCIREIDNERYEDHIDQQR